MKKETKNKIIDFSLYIPLLGLFLFAILLSAGCKAKKDDHILDNWVDYQIVSSIIVLLLFKYII